MSNKDLHNIILDKTCSYDLIRDKINDCDLNELINLLICADQLNNKKICDILSKKLADKIDSLTVEQLRDKLNHNIIHN